VLYNGNNLYNGKPLFRAAIMDSGSMVHSDPVDGLRAEVVFNTIVENAGYANIADTLIYLRSVIIQLI
jgi:acetylcholinesterase